MRKAFIKKLLEKADKSTFLFVGDLGYSVIEPYVEKYPEQYLNAGVAEQNMTGMAAGMAMEGHKVFTYSIANFNTVRALEQIRNDICYHDLDVTIVSVGGGFVYGSAGYSHHAIQDIALLGSLPNMTLLLPADALETEFCMDYVFKNKGPKYLRLGKNGEKAFHSQSKNIKKIHCFNPKEKGKIALVSVGTILLVSFEVHDILKQKGIQSALFSCSIIDEQFSENIYKVLRNYDHIFTLEEHVQNFGFGSIVKNAFNGKSKKITSYGANRDIPKLVGGQGYLRAKHGLSALAIVKDIIKGLRKK